MAEAKSLLKRKKNVDAELDFELPSSMSTPSSSIGDYTWLIYGEKKIGKTSLSSQFPNALSIMFEAGGKALKMFQIAMPTWAKFKQTIDKLSEEQHEFQTLVLDTGAIAFDRCMEYVCEKSEMVHPSDEGYGKGWDKVKKEFQGTCLRAMSLELGTVILAHDTLREVETRSGRKYQQIQPALSGQAEAFFAGVIDTIAYYHYEGNQRFLQIRGDEKVICGTRCSKNFIALDGRPVYKIPMGNSEVEAYANIVKAFNNKQQESFAPEETTSSSGDKKTSFLKKKG